MNARDQDEAQCLVKSSRGGQVLAVYAALLLAASMSLPWWRMENRAPQYGKRVLIVDVSPWGVQGDVFEIDSLGHYVGIPKMESLASTERALAPYAMGVALLCALMLPFLRRGKLRLTLALLVAAVPLGFALDLWFWQRYAVTNLDPNAALNLIADRIRSQVWGQYSVAQFQVYAMFQSGFWLAVAAGANALGFLYSERSSGPPRSAVPAASQSQTGGRLASVLLLFVGTGAAQAATLEVGPDSAYATIGAAVAAAASGDEILVQAGVYRENVKLDRPLTLRGQPGAVIDAGGRGTVVLAERCPSTVRGFLLRGSGDSFLYEDAGIKLLRARGCTVEDNRIEDSLFGILARSSPQARILRNQVTGKALPIPRRGDGIRIQDATGSVVQDNTVAHTRDLAIWQSDRCIVRGNHVFGGRYGLHYMYCDDNLFEDNVFEDNDTGGAIMYSRRLELRRNRFSGSRGASAYGLLVKVGDDVLAEGNWFVNNSVGIFLEDSPSSLQAGCTFRHNLIGGNETGLALQPSVARVVFQGNAFLANRRQVAVNGRTSEKLNRWSQDGRGNYWSDYIGFDADGNGIGDTPYRVEQFFEELVSRWPGAELLRLGPAAEALGLAARAFPVAGPEAILTDEYPLLEPPVGLGRPLRTEAQPGLAGAGLLSVFLALAALSFARTAGLGGTP